jgi:ADP-ribosylglycohydrolase
MVDNSIVLEYYDKALNGIEVNVRKNKGWCIYGMYLAFYALIHTKSYKEGIDYIIKQGGDTDTNACIGGYLLGAYYGFNIMCKDETTLKNIGILTNAKTDRSKYKNSKYLNNDFLKKIWNMVISI